MRTHFFGRARFQRISLLALGVGLTGCTQLDASGMRRTDEGGVSSADGSWQIPIVGDAGATPGVDAEPEPASPEGGSPESGSPDTGVPPVMSEACTTEAALRCTPTAGQRQVCSGGAWMAAPSCAEGEVCTAVAGADGTCVAVAEVCKGSAGKAACDGQGTLYHCNEIGVASSTEACRSARHCQQGLSAGACAACIPGEYRCTEAKLEKCNDDGRSFSTAKECETAALCNAGAGDCTSAACLPGKFSCQGDVLRKCNAQQSGWEEVKSCNAGLCDAVAGECDVCVPAAKRCDAGATLTCNATGQAYDRSVCPSSKNQCVGNGQCVECASDAECADPGACKVKHCNLGTGACEPSFALPQTACGSGKWCDGAGGCVSCLFDTDCADPGTCKLRFCNTTTHACEPKNAPSTTTCSGGHCDSGQCVQCSGAGDCPDQTCKTKSCSGGQCKYTNVPAGQKGNCASGMCTATQQCRECVLDDHCDHLDAACTEGLCVNNGCQSSAKTGSCGPLKMCSGSLCANSCGTNQSVDTPAGEECDPSNTFYNSWTCNSNTCKRTGLSASRSSTSGSSYRKRCGSDAECASNETCVIAVALGAYLGQTTPVCVPKCNGTSCVPVPGYTLIGDGQCGTNTPCYVQCTSDSQCPPGVTCVTTGGLNFCAGPFY